MFRSWGLTGNKLLFHYHINWLIISIGNTEIVVLSELLNAPLPAPCDTATIKGIIGEVYLLSIDQFESKISSTYPPHKPAVTRDRLVLATVPSQKNELWSWPYELLQGKASASVWVCDHACCDHVVESVTRDLTVNNYYLFKRLY